jgi:hypothetical protein
MEIQKFSERDAKQWEDFVPIANNGTIFHYLKFLGYHPPQRFKNHHLMIKENNNILALFPAVIEDRKVISHKGASYGGFVLKQGIGIHKTCLMVEHLIEYFKERGFQKIILTQTPLIYYREPDQYIDFALLKNGFYYRKREITAVIPIDAEDPLTTFHADARRSTKKAIREGVKVTISDDFKSFYAILKQNLGMRHNVSPTHSLEELMRLKNIFSDDIILFTAHLERKMIGGLVIFCAHENVILAFYISHDSEFQIYRPVNLLFYEVLKWGRKRNFKYLDLGTFTLNMNPNWGLGRFKENHNARGFLRDSFELNI